MIPSLPVQIVASAARAISEAAEWWSANRPKAPDAFVEDLQVALGLIALHPGIGARARNLKLKDVRRVHLARLHYYVYYRVTDDPAIEVLALWHTNRGGAPKL